MSLWRIPGRQLHSCWTTLSLKAPQSLGWDPPSGEPTPWSRGPRQLCPWKLRQTPDHKGRTRCWSPRLVCGDCVGLLASSQHRTAHWLPCPPPGLSRGSNPRTCHILEPLWEGVLTSFPLEVYLSQFPHWGPCGTVLVTVPRPCWLLSFHAW